MKARHIRKLRKRIAKWVKRSSYYLPARTLYADT